MTLDFQIKINPEYRDLIDNLSDREYYELEESILKDGQYEPITVNQHGVLLDGHNRYGICKDADIEVKYRIMHFSSKEEEIRYVINVNDKRRHLNLFQRAELAYKLEDIEKEKAKLRQIEHGRTAPGKTSIRSKAADKVGVFSMKNTCDQLHTSDDVVTGIRPVETVGRVRDIVSQKKGIPSGTYARAKLIIEKGSEEVKQKLRKGNSSIYKEYKKIRKDIDREKFLQEMKAIVDTKNTHKNGKKELWSLLLGDMCEKGRQIADNSIDLIFTDPPYGSDSIQLYESLAVLARRVLRPGGSLVFLVGHIILDKVIEIFTSCTDELRYWWIFAIKHNGNHTKIHPRNVFAQWKPMLWYVKGQKPNELTLTNTIGDFIQSQDTDKLLHEWEQSTVEAEHIIRYLTLENQKVLDPFMGSGTTGLAALQLDRKFIGIEINEDTFKIAESRLNNNFLNGKSMK